MGVNDGLKKLARKETNTSQEIFGGNQDLGMSSNGSTNASLQVESLTSPRYTSIDSIASSGQNAEAPSKNSLRRFMPYFI